MYQVLIVEDDPMVAAIDKKYVDMNPSFQVIGICENGAKALEFDRMDMVDLIILDYYMPVMNGEAFIDQLHRQGFMPAIIMVTSANDMETVSGLLARGITDYLVKPFEYERFHSALERFDQRMKLLSRENGQLEQAELDKMFSGAFAAAGRHTELGKGLNQATLEKVRSFLREHPGRNFTSEQIAQGVSLSRITVRRYVNHMTETGELSSVIDYRTGGRPGINYRYNG